MTVFDKATWIDIGVKALIVALLACVPLGIFLAIWFDNPHWLVLCATLIVFTQ